MIPQYLVDFDLQGLPVVKTDCLVIGSGIAGLFTAIKASEDRKVIMLTKKTVMESNTRYAQGGIAAVISEDDSPAYHRQDTLMAGAGLNSSAAVDVLVNEGPEGVRELIRLGTIFDKENGVLALTQEGRIATAVFYMQMGMLLDMRLSAHSLNRLPGIRILRPGMTIMSLT